MNARLTWIPAALPSASPVVLAEPPGAGEHKLRTLEGLGPLTIAAMTAKGPSQEGETALDVTIPTRVITATGHVSAADHAALEAVRAAIARAMVAIPVRFGSSLPIGRLLIERAGLADREIYALPRSGLLDYLSPTRGALDLEWLCPYPYFQETSDSSLTLPDVTTGIAGAAATNIITAADHDLAVGDAVKFTGLVGGAGLTDGTIYYVIAGSFTTGQLKVSATAGGAEVNFTTNITAGSLQKISTAVNAGDVDAPISALVYGPATQVTIANETTGELFTVDVTLADGTQWLAVDTSPGVKSIRKYTAAGVWTSALAGLDRTTARLFLLQPGNNLLRLEATGAGAATYGSITWRNRYAGI